MSAGYNCILAMSEIRMASVTIRNLDEDVVERLRTRAAANKRSLQAELRDVLTKVAGGGSVFDLRACAEKIAATTPKRKQTSGVPLLRRDRRR
jgi:plasmid stability protein